MTEPLHSDAASAATGEIVAGRASYYRNTRILVVLMILGFGGAFLYDGFVRYPAYNEEYSKASPADQVRMDKPHQPKDIDLQRELGCSLLPVGVLMIAWFLFNSRGQYRLAGDTLHVPGHPPIPLGSITDLDKAKWERKGIAYVDYALPSGETGRARLDDFIYERKPTDAIVEKIERSRPPAGGPLTEPLASTEGSDAATDPNAGSA